jgi:hypothetical protein
MIGNLYLQNGQPKIPLMRKLIALILVWLPTLAFADSAEINIDCKDSPYRFISDLQLSWISKSPHKVADSINYFRPKKGNGLYLQGIPISEVFGYSEDNPTFFKRGPGTSPGNRYGVIMEIPYAVALRALNMGRLGTAKIEPAGKHLTKAECRLNGE